MDITFLGAAGTVTGSCHLVRVGGKSLLLDCGQFQGGHVEEAHNRDRLEIDPSEVDAVVLSHAHIDHSGRLPLIRKQGFTGPIYTHHASRALCEIMLRDSGYLHEKDAEWENKRRARKHLPEIEPLYTRADADAVMEQFHGIEFGERQNILPGVDVCLRKAGHILGAAVVELWLTEGAAQRKLVFSGDLGYGDAAVMDPPTRIEQADLVLMESTYGDRNHRPFESTVEELGAIFEHASSVGGNILIPAFAVGRTQDILYLLEAHREDWRLDRWQIFLDSPMAIETTELYWRYRNLYQTKLFPEGRRPALPNVVASMTTEESMRINKIESGALIIAASGMCTGGRIMHHLKHNLWRKQCHVIFVGFQGQGTLGRRIVDGATHVRLLQETIRVGAAIHTVGGLSAHADQDGLDAWYGAFQNTPPVTLVHGEPRAQEAFAARLRKDYGVEARIPALGDVLPIT